jgi:hypothetical protein
MNEIDAKTLDQSDQLTREQIKRIQDEVTFITIVMERSDVAARFKNPVFSGMKCTSSIHQTAVQSLLASLSCCKSFNTDCM